MKTLVFLFLVLFVSIFVFASNLQSDLDAVVQAERDFAKLSVEKGRREAFLTFLAEDSVVFTPAPTPGKAAAEKMSAAGQLSWYPIYADIANSGDMGYTTGPWKFRDPQKPDNAGYGEFNSVWKKQPDGNWKNVCDFGIHHPAPETPVTHFQSASLKGRKLDSAGSQSAQTLRDELMAADRKFSQDSKENGTSAAYRSILTSDSRLFRSECSRS
jgi:ketosteroid isomerase-like protein